MKDRTMARAATQPQRTRRSAEDRRRAILAAAQKVFLERGYANASIDAVVELAGGSKATVYQQFGNKEGLLGALVAEGAEELAHLVHALPLDGALEDSLRAFGKGYLGLIMRPDRLALFRLTIGECGRVPEIGDVFYRTGPQMVAKYMTEFFRGVAGSGLIATTDPERTANQFIHALRGDLYLQNLLNPTRRPTEGELNRHIDFVVDSFLAGVRAKARIG
jgi:TetR/AcrR family transcriptional regulator, mexJK operon transcriptional repressor